MIACSRFRNSGERWNAERPWKTLRENWGENESLERPPATQHAATNKGVAITWKAVWCCLLFLWVSFYFFWAFRSENAQPKYRTVRTFCWINYLLWHFFFFLQILAFLKIIYPENEWCYMFQIFNQLTFMYNTCIHSPEFTIILKDNSKLFSVTCFQFLPLLWAKRKNNKYFIVIPNNYNY